MAPVIVPCRCMRHCLVSVSRQTVGGFRLGCILQACSDIATTTPAESTCAAPFDAKQRPWWSATRQPLTFGVDIISSITLSNSFSMVLVNFSMLSIKLNKYAWWLIKQKHTRLTRETNVSLTFLCMFWNYLIRPKLSNSNFKILLLLQHKFNTFT